MLGPFQQRLEANHKSQTQRLFFFPKDVNKTNSSIKEPQMDVKLQRLQFVDQVIKASTLNNSRLYS